MPIAYCLDVSKLIDPTRPTESYCFFPGSHLSVDCVRTWHFLLLLPSLGQWRQKRRRQYSHHWRVFLYLFLFWLLRWWQSLKLRAAPTTIDAQQSARLWSGQVSFLRKEKRNKIKSCKKFNGSVCQTSAQRFNFLFLLSINSGRICTRHLTPDRVTTTSLVQQC